MKRLIVFSCVVMLVCLGVGVSFAQTAIITAPDSIKASGNYIITVDTLDCTAEVGGIVADLAPDNVVIDGDGKLILGKSGPPYYEYGIKIYYAPEGGGFATGESVYNCRIKNMGHGLMIKGLKNSDFYDLEMDSCNRGIGAYKGSDYYEAVNFLDNKITNTAEFGMKLYKMTGCQISGNTISNAGQEGIRCYEYVDSCELKNNVITNCAKEGMEFRKSSYTSIDSNVCIGNDIGIYIDNDISRFNTLTADSIIGGNIGLKFRDADSNMVVNMVINGADSMDIGVQSDGEAVGNVIKDSKIINVATTDINVKAKSELTLINTDFDPLKVLVEYEGVLNVGHRVTVKTKLDAVLIAGTTVEIENAAGEEVYSKEITDADAGLTAEVIELIVTVDGDSVLNPFTVSGYYNDMGKVYTDEVEITVSADTSITLDLERDYSLGYYVLIDQGATFTVTDDTIDCSVDSCDGIRVRADDVTIDGNGKLLLGAGSAVDKQGLYARAASGAVLNVNVSNLTVEGFRHGAYYRMATGTIDNCTFIDCQKGANINSRRSPLVTGVVFSNNTLSWPANSDFTKMAIEFRGGPDGKILNNTIIVEDTIGTGIGVERGWPIAEGGYNTVNGLYEGNTITITGDGKVEKGFLLDRSIDNTFVDNTITGSFDYGIDIGGSPTIFSTGNVFTNTEITGVSGTGVRFLFSSDNEFDSLTVTSTDYAVVASSASKGNVVRDSELADSIIVEGNSNLFLANTNFDQSKVLVEKGSAVFVGEKLAVNVTVLLLNVSPTKDVDVIVKNAAGDELNSYVTDEDGNVYFELAPEGFSVSGYSAVMNPFTITTSMLIEGALYEDVVMATITSDTSFTLALIPVGVDREKYLPDKFALSQNYPNPFNPITTISYELPVESKVTLRIYNTMGGLVRTLVNEEQYAGYKNVIWNGRNESGSKVSSGIYFYRIAAGDFTQVKKMVFLK